MFNSHILNVMEVVHGSSKNKKDLEKEIQEKVPEVARKSAKIKQFLSTYCNRTKDPVANNSKGKKGGGG